MAVDLNGRAAVNPGYIRRPMGPAKLSWAFTIKMSEEDGLALRRLADRRGETVGEIIRKLLRPVLIEQK